MSGNRRGVHSSYRSIDFLVILLLICFVSGCTSKRKISNIGVRDPRSVVSDNRSDAIEATEISRIRNQALHIQPKGSCSSELTKYLNKLSLTHLPQPKCPEGFEDRVVEAMQSHQLSSEEGLLYESLRKISCKGRALVARSDDQYSIAESLATYLNRRPTPKPREDDAVTTASLAGREPSSKAEKRRILREIQEREAAATKEREKLSLLDTIAEDLRQINDQNVAVQRRIALTGSYLLTEENLRFIINLIDNGCRMQSIRNYFARDNASLIAMERTESLIRDPSLKREFAKLRRMVQGILDEYIESFF